MADSPGHELVSRVCAGRLRNAYGQALNPVMTCHSKGEPLSCNPDPYLTSLLLHLIRCIMQLHAHAEIPMLTGDLM